MFDDLWLSEWVEVQVRCSSGLWASGGAGEAARGSNLHTPGSTSFCYGTFISEAPDILEDISRVCTVTLPCVSCSWRTRSWRPWRTAISLLQRERNWRVPNSVWRLSLLRSTASRNRSGNKLFHFQSRGFSSFLHLSSLTLKCLWIRTPSWSPGFVSWSRCWIERGRSINTDSLRRIRRWPTWDSRCRTSWRSTRTFSMSSSCWIWRSTLTGRCWRARRRGEMPSFFLMSKKLITMLLCYFTAVFKHIICSIKHKVNQFQSILSKW